MQVQSHIPSSQKSSAGYTYPDKKIKNILVPVCENHDSYNGLYMAFLLCAQIGCEITLAYLVPDSNIQDVETHRSFLHHFIKDKVDPDLRLGHFWNKYRRSIHVLISGFVGSRASKILQLADDGSFDLVIIWTPLFKKRQYGSVFIEIPDRFKLMKAINCPLICLSEIPAQFTIEKILLPINDSIDVFLKVNKAVEIASALKSHISLLTVLDDPSEKERKNALELLELCKKHIKSSKVSTSSKIIVHHDQYETTLAYANIIRTGLICNCFSNKECFNRFGSEHLSKKTILHSYLPTYNVYYKQL